MTMPASGFDNLSSRLSLSPAQMEKYFTAADKVLERVLGRPDGKPAGEGFNRHQAQQALQALLFVKPSDKVSKRDAARQIISRFARRAFRRPVRDGEIDRLLRLYDLADKKGDRHENGVRLMLKAVLVSPRFLMRLEQVISGCPGSTRRLPRQRSRIGLAFVLFSVVHHARRGRCRSWRTRRNFLIRPSWSSRSSACSSITRHGHLPIISACRGCNCARSGRLGQRRSSFLPSRILCAGPCGRRR